VPPTSSVGRYLVKPQGISSSAEQLPHHLDLPPCSRQVQRRVARLHAGVEHAWGVVRYFTGHPCIRGKVGRSRTMLLSMQSVHIVCGWCDSTTWQEHRGGCV
jgi:hypothetical protein